VSITTRHYIAMGAIFCLVVERIELSITHN
jgi:hypothetical protein